jgi:beta-galactosidase
VTHPRLWSAEFPNLYALSVELKGPDGRVRERVTRKVGIREVSIKDGVFCVNRVPVKLVGICRHDVYPTLGTAINAGVWRKDLTLMKAANFNAIRTSHYPYGSGFYDLCDEMGFYVLDEEPFCWVDCGDTNLTPGFAQRARETVRRDKNHPCVVIWGVGNENRPGTNSTLAAHLTRQLDPTRPRLVSSRKAEEAGANVEFDDAHYVTPAQIHKAEHDARRAKWPMIYTENPNVWEERNGPDYGELDLWRPVIQRTWDELWQDDHVTGTFLWEWQDRAVADKCPTKEAFSEPPMAGRPWGELAELAR